MAKAWLKSLVAAMGLLGASQSVVANTSNYTVYTNAAGDIYLKAPEQFVLIHSDVSIPLFITPADGYLKAIKNADGSWSTISIPAPEWNNLSLNQGGNIPNIASLGAYIATSGLVKPGATLGVGGLSITATQVPDETVSFSVPNESTSLNTFALPSQGGVSGGQANYEVPLTIAPGRAGMQPKISVAYSSQGGNGTLGVGWQLSVGGSLSRCAPTFEQDELRDKSTKVRAVTFDPTTDRLCLNGQRLMVVSGIYNNSGAIYRTEMDSGIRVSQDGNINDSTVNFKVEYPDGRKAFFGSEPASQVKGDESGALAFAWLLSKEVDVTDNNTIDYVYQNIGKGEVLLQSVFYTGTQNQRGEQQVNFYYEDRPDISFGYRYGSLIGTTQRLKTVSVASAFVTETRSYEFNYKQSGHSTRSLLDSIQYCAAEDCSIPLQFSWSDAKGAIVTDALKFSGQHTLAGAKWMWEIAPFGDLDGDGAADFKGKMTNAEQETNKDNTYDSNLNCIQRGKGLDCPMIDADVDGKMDPINWRSGALSIDLSYTSTSFATGFSFNGFHGADQNPDRIESTADFNGDGYPDLLLYTYKTPVSTWTLYTNTRDRHAPFSSRESVVIRTETDTKLVTRTIRPGPMSDAGDLNGDGLPDLVSMMPAPGILGAAKANLVQRFYYSNPNNSTRFNIVKANLSSTVSLGDDVYIFQTMLDVNGDGASDVVSLQDYQNDVRLGYQLNNGLGVFGAWLPFGGNYQLPLREHSAAYNANAPLNVYTAKYMTMPAVDINHDGLNELMVPGQLMVKGCSTVGFPGTPGTKRTLCGNDLYGSVPYSSQQKYPSYPIDSEYLDDSIYQFDAVSFVPQADGSINLVATPTSYYGSASQSRFMDAFGDGQIDLVTAYGPRAAGSINVSSIETSTAQWPISAWGTNWGAYISRNYGSGQGQNTADYHAVDLMVGVNNGQGKRHGWTYKPLTSGVASAGQERLYCISETDVGKTQCSEKNHYADGSYTNFGSSMYVVQSFQAPSGQASTTETQYAYRGAMFNVGGRGFTGFRLMIEKDVQRDLIIQSQFSQKFPFVGLLLSSTVQTPNAVIKRITNTWSDNSAHANTNARSNFVYLNTQTSSKNESYDLLGNLLSTKESWVDTVDEYGNAKNQYTQHTDKVDGIDVIYKSVTTTVFSPDETAWWLNKYDSLISTSTLVQNTWQNVLSPTNLDNAANSSEKTVVVNSWNTARQPLQTTTTANKSSCVLTNNFQYNSYGLPTSTSMASSGCGVTHTRATEIQYTKNGTTAADDGYLPLQVTNGLNQTTKTTYHMLSGLPISVEQPSGVSETVSYDNAGRPLSKTTTGMPTEYVRYLPPNASANNPTNSLNPAVLLVRSSQAGAPIKENFLDSLGRTTRAAIQVFDGRYSYQDTTFDVLGRPLTSTEPHFGTPDAITEYGGYDSLDRPSWRSIPNGNASGLISTYQYAGLKTSITVEGRTMSRTYGTNKYLYETVDANGNSNRFAYDGVGNPLVIQDADGNKITATYNGFGHKTQVNDPNQGLSDFSYNAFGELYSSKDANGVTTQLTLDALGRVKQRDIIGGPAAGTHTFEWDTIKAGLLSSSTANGVKKTYSYNTALQPLTESVEIDGVSRTVNYQYDTGIGRLKGLQYPNGLTIAYEYNATGYLQKIKNAATGYTYKNITAMDAEGHVTDASLANGNIASKNHYNPDGTMAYTQATSAVMGVIHNIGYTRYDSFMNPLEETNYSAGETQTYSYDNMNRLVSYSLLRSGFSPITVSYGYTATGNFQYKSDFSTATNGAYQYGGSSSCLASQFAGPNAVCRVTKANNSVVTYQYDKAGNLTSGDGLTSIQYDANHMPINISGRGANSAFVYDADGARARQTLSTGGRTKTTYYVGKLFEADADGAWRAYIDDVAILSYSPEGAASLQFTLRDRLGSAVTIADGNGMLVSRRFFDPFGKSGNIGTDQVSTNRNRRGFTDHEHLLEQSLIHMNGRVYDQNLGRFLSVDPFIQEPTSTQNINAYSYVLNNPLTGTDPTGYTRLDALREKSIEKFDNFMSTKADDIKSMQVTENGSKLTFAVNMKDGSTKSLTAAGKLSDVGGQLESSEANGPPSHKLMPENLNDFTNGDMTFPQGTNPLGAKQEVAEVMQAAAEHWGWGEESALDSPLAVDAPITSQPQKSRAFSDGNRHTGTDYGVPEGTPVMATANGVVVSVDNHHRHYGQTILIRHNNGVYTRYAHGSRLDIQEGSLVKKGQVIMLSGNTGRSKNPHLHYEVIKTSRRPAANGHWGPKLEYSSYYRANSLKGLLK